MRGIACLDHFSQVHEGDANYEFELMDGEEDREEDGEEDGGGRKRQVVRGVGLLEFGGVLVGK